MIIFGSRTWGKLLATLTLICRNCHIPAAQQLIKRNTWFTLFFIPVIPLYVKRSITCTYCGVTTKLSKTEADQLVAGSTQGSPAPQAGPAPAQYNQQQPGQPYQQQPAQPYNQQPPQQYNQPYNQ